MAQLLAHLLRDLEVISTGHLIETSRKELLSGSSDADKQMSQVCKAANGGVLLVTDVHTFQDRERSKDSDGMEAAECLAKQLNAMTVKCSGDSPGPCFPQAMCV